MGIRSREVKKHVVLKAAGGIFPSYVEQTQGFPSRTGCYQNSVAPHKPGIS